jgi:hypothetical protein
MAFAILKNTPLWAWAILVGLIVVGLLQARQRYVPPALVVLLPAAMIAFSLVSLRSSFGWQLDAQASWAAGVAVAAILNSQVFLAPRGVRYDAATNRFEMPGSWVPLLLMLAIFSARYVINVTAAISPATVADANFIRAISMMLGFCSGLFLARSLLILHVRRAASEASSGA